MRCAERVAQRGRRTRSAEESEGGGFEELAIYSNRPVVTSKEESLELCSHGGHGARFGENGASARKEREEREIGGRWYVLRQGRDGGGDGWSRGAMEEAYL